MNLAEALEMVVRTDPGRVRSHNEDAVFIDAALGVAILADGMGGYSAGEVASGMATTLLADGFAQFIPTLSVGGSGVGDPGFVERHIADEVSMTNAAIYNASLNQPNCTGMGTTLVLAWFYDNHVSVGHVGDSRMYRLRGEVFEQLTRDHSLLQEQLDNGIITPEEARYSQNKNLVTRALGVDGDVVTEVHDYDVRVGDIFMLCSDGLNDMVEDDEIALTLRTLGRNLTLAADQLIEMANDNGGRDNISVILIKARESFASRQVWWHSLLGGLK